MQDFVPIIASEEKELICAEIRGKKVSVIFDGTTRVHECFAIVVRYVNDGGKSEQRLLHLGFYKKAFNALELQVAITQVLLSEYRVALPDVVAFIRDRASVNSAAVRSLLHTFPHALDIGCLSHTLDHCGDEVYSGTLHDFWASWNSLFCRSLKASTSWRQKYGVAVPSCSPTRWWSKRECLHFILVNFGQVGVWVNRVFENKEVEGANIRRLHEIMTDMNKMWKLRLELAAVVELTEVFQKATYILEGDGPLCCTTWQVLEHVKLDVDKRHPTMDYPSTRAIIRELVLAMPGPVGELAVNHWVAYAREMTEPAVSYLNRKVFGELLPIVEVFKACRIVNPAYIQSVSEILTAAYFRAETQLLVDIQLVTIAEVDACIPEIARMVQAAGANTFTVIAGRELHAEIISFWQTYRAVLPGFAALYYRCLLLQPSSASSERVFSILKRVLGKSQREYWKTTYRQHVC
jgi:hypothetical protein